MLEAMPLALAATDTIALAPPRHIFSVTAYANAAATLQTALAVALPKPGHTLTVAGILWLWSGQNSWLAISDSPIETILAPATPHAALTDQSDGKAVFLAAGPRIRETLQKLIPIDLHETGFLPNHTALTLAGHIPIQLWRDGETFHLACFRSFGPALHHALLEADFG